MLVKIMIGDNMFFDNASTTKVDERIIDNLKNINNEYFYNPGGLYSGGRKSKEIVESARCDILKLLNGTGKLIFTGSATECNNLALFGSVKKNTRTILVSVGEHPCVYNSALELKQRGYDVKFIPLNNNGSVDVDRYKELLNDAVDFISIMHISNETGAINDIKSLVEMAKAVNPKVIFHSDGVQACGKVSVDLDDLGVDMYTISAHKIYGFKGVGALYVKKGVNIKPIIFGGGQEGGLRSGTENVMGIYSLGEAIKFALNELEENYKKINKFKEKFLSLIKDSGLNYSVHARNNSSPYIVSISFPGCRAETILNMLSDKGIYIGNGSACSSSKIGNRILENMGVSKKEIESNLRISFGKYNTDEEIDVLANELISIVKKYLSNV